MRKRPAVALEDDQRRAQDDTAVLQQFHKRVVHRLVDHAVDQNVGAFFNRCACGFQFRCMHHHPNLAGVTFLNGRSRNRTKRLHRMILVDDVPNFYKVRFLFSQFAHELARSFWTIDFHDRRIAQIEFFARHAREERACRRHAWRFRRRARFFADFEIPHRPAVIDHAGDSASQITREHVIQVRFHPCDFLPVRSHAAQIGDVRPGKQIARLKEVNVRVDVTWQNELAGAIDLFSERRRVLFANRDALNLVAVDHDRRVRCHFAVCRINHRRADQRKFLGARSESEKRRAKAKQKRRFHSLDSGTAFSAALNPILEWVPSQNGFSVDAPQRQSAMRLCAGNLLPSASINSTSPVTM